jgi:hypothetical protein
MKLGQTLALVAGAILSLASADVGASTYEEPFDVDVVREAETFVVGTLKPGRRPSLVVERVLAGEAPRHRTVRVDGLGDAVPDRPSQVYAWLDREGKTWRVATPTSNVDYFHGPHVLGSFRISCAGGLYEPALYERVQAAWFKALHGDESGHPELREFVSAELVREPETLEGRDATQALGFFRQHAAMEILASVPSLAPALDLTPFLYFQDMHAQISAVRAIAARVGSTQAMVDFLADERAQEVPALVAARLLRGRTIDEAQRGQLEAALTKSSTEKVWLCGGSIMDPRYTTDYSEVSVHDALTELLRP